MQPSTSQLFFEASNVLFEGPSANRVASALQKGILGREGRVATADFCLLGKGVCKGNLGIPRSKMPQIAENHVKDFIKYLKGLGFDSKKSKVPVDKMKATQKEIKAEKAEGISQAILDGKFKGGPAILMSSDNHILDGHHRWAGGLLAKVRKGIDVVMNVIKVNLPIKKLLEIARSFDKVEFKDLNDKPTTKRASMNRIATDLRTLFPDISTAKVWNKKWNKFAALIFEQELFRGSLEDADLRGVGLMGANLSAYNINSTNFNGADLRNMTYLGGRLFDTRFDGADLRGAKFLRVGMSGVHFTNCNANDASFEGSTMQYAKLDGSDLVKADFTGVYLKEGTIEGANIDKADFTGAKLRGVDLDSAFHSDRAILRGVKYL